MRDKIHTSRRWDWWPEATPVPGGPRAPAPSSRTLNPPGYCATLFSSTTSNQQGSRPWTSTDSPNSMPDSTSPASSTGGSSSTRPARGSRNHPEREEHEKTLGEILQRRDELQVSARRVHHETSRRPRGTGGKGGPDGHLGVLAQDLEKCWKNLAYEQQDSLMMNTLLGNKIRIVCTIGPASDSPETLERMIQAGMNVARLNFSHGDFDIHARVIERIRAASEKTGRRVAIWPTCRGPKMRIGDFGKEPVVLEKGPVSSSRPRTWWGTANSLHHMKELAAGRETGGHALSQRRAHPASRGRVEGDEIHCIVITGGELRSRKGLNVPGIDLGTSALPSATGGAWPFPGPWRGCGEPVLREQRRGCRGSAPCGAGDGTRSFRHRQDRALENHRRKSSN